MADALEIAKVRLPQGVQGADLALLGVGIAGMLSLIEFGETLHRVIGSGECGVCRRDRQRASAAERLQ